jgi:hypothetical protein
VLVLRIDDLDGLLPGPTPAELLLRLLEWTIRGVKATSLTFSAVVDGAASSSSA